MIDEYDTPVQSGYISGYYDQIVDFIRIWLSGALKDNTNLNFAILTGILRIAKESIFSGLNNIEVNTILNTEYSHYFGFTQDEVNQIAQNYACEEKLTEIREWYDGYDFGGREIYNPWSVINYFKDNCRTAPYWLNISSNDIVKILIERSTPEVKENLQRLFQGETIEVQVDDVVVYPEIFQNADAMYTMLLLIGYLKVISSRKLNAFFKIYELVIPNLEIKAVYQKEVKIRKSERV